MDQGTKVGAFLVLGLVGGYAIAKLAAPTLPDCTAKVNRTVNVSAKGRLDCLVTYIGTPHRITWRAPVGTTLVIGPTPLFPYLKCGENNLNNQCESYGVDPNTFAETDPVGTKKEFEYTVKLGSTVAPNGRIIIEK